MHALFMALAIGAYLGGTILWSLLAIACLRAFDIRLPLSLAVPFRKRNAPEILEALSERSINVYVCISGLLLFACPLFAGLTAFDYITRRYIEHSSYSASQLVFSGLFLMSLGIGGVWKATNEWARSRESGFGSAMWIVLALKVPTDVASTKAVIFLWAPLALGCLVIYLGLRAIRRVAPNGRASKLHNSWPATNFVAETFVPTENYKAQQAAMDQILRASAFDPEQIQTTRSAHIHRPEILKRERRRKRSNTNERDRSAP